jgi:proline dehydrogenase
MIDVRRLSLLGTHNEESTYNLIEHMKSKGVDTKDERIWFGQLYGK